MSERGTFVTSYLYDYIALAPLLRRLLPQICRDGCAPIEYTIGLDDPGERTRMFAGIMHASWSGEEVLTMDAWINDVLLSELPAEHGHFSIVVVPESDIYTAVFSIYKREVTVQIGRAHV